MKRISYTQLKKKLIELDYNKAEIKSTVKSIRKFDRDLKLAVYYWLNMGAIPGGSDPSFVISGKYSIRMLCDDFGMTPPAAFIVLQTYRRNPREAEEMIFYSSSRSTPNMSDEEVAFLYQKFGITDDDDAQSEDETDVDIPDADTKSEGGA